MDELNKLEIKIDKIDPHGYARMSKMSGASAASDKAEVNMMKQYGEDEEYDPAIEILGARFAGRNKWRGNSKRPPEQKGRFKTTNGLKESVLEEIYEAELCGDITPEERQSLIYYMNI